MRDPDIVLTAFMIIFCLKHVQGLIGDSEYAETYVRSKWRQQLWAPRRLGMVCGDGRQGGGVACTGHCPCL